MNVPPASAPSLRVGDWEDIMTIVSGFNRNLILVAAAILAVGIVVGGYLLGDGIRRARMADRAVTVRGLAERNVTADLATWTISLSAQDTDLAAARNAVEEDARTLNAFFRRTGFRPEDLSDAGATVSQFYDSNRGVNSITVRRQFQLRTSDVGRARQAYARQFELIRDGVAIDEGSSMVYSFTRLNDVKPAMIADATRDARRGAEQFARDSGNDVRGIRSATQGYFSITARDGDDNEGSGRDSPYQKVRVVTTIEFYLG
jgi:hypothetical protein